MPGVGTLINMAAIVAGGAVGLLFGKRFSEKTQDALMVACGICVLFIGIAGALSEMLTFSAGHFGTQGTLCLIVCFVLGTAIGEFLDIETWFENFGLWLKRKSGNEKDAGFLNAFVTSSLVVCIGAMAVVGAIEDGLQGDIAMLEAKALLDAIIILAMSASMGKGCVFSAIPVGLFQGSITLLAFWLKPLMTPAALSNISLVGSVMIFCVGVNLVFGKRVRVANTLPALILAVIWALLAL